MKKNILFILTFVLSIIVLNQASALGIQASPASLHFNDVNVLYLTVTNPTADVLLFEAETENFTEKININPSSFTLESGASKKVAVSVSNFGLTDQVVSTNINLIASPLANKDLNISAGAKIPVEIRNVKFNNVNNLNSNLKILRQYSPWLLVLILAGTWLWQSKRQKSNIS